MSKPNKEIEQWMPVFAVPRGGIVHSAAHPTEATSPGYEEAAKLQIRAENNWQRIGTAIKREDGSLVLELIRIPETKYLVIRSARNGEAET
jgi:hypothetical protein